MEEFIQNKQHTIIKNSEEEEKFLLKLMNIIENIDILNISNKESLKSIIQEYVRILETLV